MRKSLEPLENCNSLTGLCGALGIDEADLKSSPNYSPLANPLSSADTSPCSDAPTKVSAHRTHAEGAPESSALAPSDGALQPLSILLPWPPSTNDLWRAVKRRNIMSQRYRDWIAEAEHALALQHHYAIPGPVTVTVELCPPTNRVFDLDNFVKATLDFIVGAGVLEADNNRVIRQITVKSGAGFNGAWVHIEPMGEA